jgi:tetratricopeptide (TPR) repeat protein
LPVETLPRNRSDIGPSRPVKPSAPVDPSTSGESRILIACLLLVVVTLAFYNPIVHNQFTGFDDWSYILKNSHVQSGLTWDTVKWSFTTFHEGNWHPLTWLSHALDCQIFHLNPVGHHYTNVLFHAINAVLLFLLLRRATGTVWPNLVVAALFALHPINVESVAWASERKNVLSMFFFLLALGAYDRYARTGRRGVYLWLMALFAFGLMAKPQIVTLPFVLLLWDYWPLQRMGACTAVLRVSGQVAPRSLRFLIWEKVPLFVVAGADSVVTAIAQRSGNAVRSISEFSISARLETAVVSYVRYIGKAFWPSHLAPMYPRPQGLLPVWPVVGSVVLLLMLSALVYYWRERRYLVMGWMWFLGTLVPMIGIMTVGDQAMADRYAYLPFIGLFVAVVWTLDEFTNGWRISNAVRVCAVAVVLLVLGYLTYRQVGVWKDDDTLWHYTLRVTEGNYVAHNNLALMLAKEGRSEEALVEFRAAKSLHKYPANQVLALAFYELRIGHPREAIEECNSVLDSSDPVDPKMETVAWAELGQAYLYLHQYPQASESYQKALRLDTENEMALAGAGLMALREEQTDLATQQLAHAAKVNPSATNFLLLTEGLRHAGRWEQADAAIAQAQKAAPDLSNAENEAGLLLSAAGVPPESARGAQTSTKR